MSDTKSHHKKKEDHTSHHHHDDKKKSHTSFTCHKCDKKFDDMDELSKHKKTHEHEHHEHKEDSLEKLKDEILGEVNKKDKKRLSWGSGLVTTILVVLTLVSVIQTAQSVNILSKINSGDFKSSGGSSTSALPSNLESLPNMVGGC